MSNFPSFLQTSRPSNPIVTYGDELSAEQINALRSQIRTLHFHPIVIVCPKTFHVKDGNATVAEIAREWGLGPHGMLILYSPAHKEVWATCGKFNTSAGVDVAFFKRDFSQRMSNDSLSGDLGSALNASLQDVDRIIVSSQAYAARAVNNQTSTRIAHNHHAPGYPLGQVFPAIVLALLVLGVISKASGKGRTRRMRLEDQRDQRYSTTASTPGLARDVDRILQVMGANNGEDERPKNPKNPKNTQVPMAEFKKRASVPIGRATSSGSAVSGGSAGDYSNRRYNSGGGAEEACEDHAADFQTAIESSAARARQEARQVASERAAEQEVLQGEAGGVANSFADRSDSPRFESSASVGSGDSSSAAIPFTGSAPNSASDAFNNSFGAQPFADMMTRLGDTGTASTALPSTQADIACPKCAEPKAKDFSFCLKCGHNF